MSQTILTGSSPETGAARITLSSLGAGGMTDSNPFSLSLTRNMGNLYLSYENR